MMFLHLLQYFQKLPLAEVSKTACMWERDNIVLLCILIQVGIVLHGYQLTVAAATYCRKLHSFISETFYIFRHKTKKPEGSFSTLSHLYRQLLKLKLKLKFLKLKLKLILIKGEIAQNRQFLLLPQCFQLFSVIRPSFIETFHSVILNCLQSRLLQICCMWERVKGKH